METKLFMKRALASSFRRYTLVAENMIAASTAEAQLVHSMCVTIYFTPSLPLLVQHGPQTSTRLPKRFGPNCSGVTRRGGGGGPPRVTPSRGWHPYEKKLWVNLQRIVVRRGRTGEKGAGWHTSEINKSDSDEEKINRGETAEDRQTDGDD